MIHALNFPFDTQTILRKKKTLKRELLEHPPAAEVRVAILAGSTADEIRNILELFLLKNAFKPLFYLSDYNKYYEDAVFPNPELEAFKPDVILVHTSVVNITRFPGFSNTSEEVDTLLNAELTKYKSIWKALKKYNCAIVQNNFDLPLNRSLGSLDSYEHRGKTHYLNRLNMEFAKSAREIKNLYINDINYLAAYLGIKNWFDRTLWHSAKYALSFDAIPEYCNQVANLISSITGKAKKCLVLDLDNTCWGGIIGDDGLNGISLGSETASGESFMYFQNYVKELKDRGIILAVSSKNEDDLAREGFTHSDTILKIDDFTSFKANWEPKWVNIKSIASDINIGLDSLVFIDDNSVEREIVSSQLPMVAVPDVGSDVIRFVDHIDRSGYFEPISLSDDDVNRNKFYADNIQRREEQQLFANYEDFLRSLEMEAEIDEFQPDYLERITQLINKTNQFNLTTKRYSTKEIETIASDDDHITLYGKLKDKFGDNGLIAVAIGKIINQECHIDAWLMSCRVLKRNMEFAMMDSFVDRCKKKGVRKIFGYYYRTPKNNMVADLYNNLGFELLENCETSSTWILDVDKYVNLDKIIEKNGQKPNI